MKILILILSIISGCEIVKSAEILAVIPTPYYSHQATFRPLWRELAKRGHKITLVTTDPMELNENITQIDYSAVYEAKKEFAAHANNGTTNPLGVLKGFSGAPDRILTHQLTHPDLVKLYNNKKFDVLLVEMILPVFTFLSVKFNCPFIGLSTMDASLSLHNAVGNVINPVVHPFNDLGYGEKLSLVQRFKSIGFLLGFFGVMKPFFSYHMNWYVKKYVGEDIPDIFEIEKNVSAIFVNANPLFFPPRAVTPTTVILGGGLHIGNPKPLPKDLQKYLDDSKDGCIYVSFGTTVNSEYLSEEQKNTFVNVFKSMAPMKILWKFDDLNVAKGAKNIEVRKWLPQQDVLRHPNVKLFITQGGLQSMEEAIDSAVPMLGMPFYGDQLNNVNKMHDKKFGLRLNPTDMTEKTLKSSIDELIQNPSYKQMTNKISAIAKDQPMNGLEKAVWWTEYVIRHGGTQHLRSPSADIPLYQYFFLDVISVTVAIMCVAYIIMKRVLRLACSTIRSLKDLYYASKDKKE